MWNTQRGQQIIGEYREALRHLRESGRISGKKWRECKDKLMQAESVPDCEKVYRDAQKGMA